MRPVATTLAILFATIIESRSIGALRAVRQRDDHKGHVEQRPAEDHRETRHRKEEQTNGEELIPLAYKVPDVNMEKRRVWLTYRSGHHDQTMQLLQSYSSDDKAGQFVQQRDGIKIHFHFPRTNALVVTATIKEIQSMKDNPNVLSVEEDAKLYPMYLPGTVRRMQLRNDTQEVPYGVRMVQADQAWEAGVTGAGVKVCVIDSGIDEAHEDFEQMNLSGLRQVGLQWGTDGSGHGTHVSGTVAAANNGIGVVGVAPEAEVYTIKVFSDSGSFAYSSTVADAANKCNEVGANIVSMSLGSHAPTFAELRAYVELMKDGVLTIAAAGNDGNGRQSFPASYQGVISVAAVDSEKVVAPFSQYNGRVDIAAPGVDVLSTLPTNQKCAICLDLGVQSYGTISGTSMATPHVSGVAALAWSFKPDATVSDIQNALLLTAEDIDLNGRDDHSGYGIVRAMDALEMLNGGPLLGGKGSASPTVSAAPTELLSDAPSSSPTSQCGGDQETLFELLLETDSFGEQTFWQLVREVDDFPILAGAGLESDFTYKISECLPLTCYGFRILDAGNNGLCCDHGNGGFVVSVDGVELVSGKSFGSSQSASFGPCSNDDTSENENVDEGDDADGGAIEDNDENHGNSDTGADNKNCTNVEFILQTDAYPEENAFTLVNDDDSSEVVWSYDGANGDLAPHTEHRYSSCIDHTQCYVFILIDTFADGLCCQFGDGWFQLRYDGATIASGGNNFSSYFEEFVGDGCTPFP